MDRLLPYPSTLSTQTPLSRHPHCHCRRRWLPPTHEHPPPPPVPATLSFYSYPSVCFSTHRCFSSYTQARRRSHPLPPSLPSLTLPPTNTLTPVIFRYHPESCRYPCSPPTLISSLSFTPAPPSVTLSPYITHTLLSPSRPSYYALSPHLSPPMGYTPCLLYRRFLQA